MLALHGALWLQMRADTVIANRARSAIGILGLVVPAAFALGGIWLWLGIDGYRIVSEPAHSALPNPLAKEVVRAAGAWFDIYAKLPVAMLLPLTGLLMPVAARQLSRVGRPGLGFVASSLGMTGIIGTAGAAMFPFLLPSSTQPNASLTVWDAASSHLTLKIMFFAVLIFLPIVLAYTLWAYRAMWGRVTLAQIEAKKHSAY